MIFIVFLIWMVLIVSMMAIADHVLIVQYVRHQDTWVADGKPLGFFFQPKESVSPFFERFRNARASRKRMWSLLFRTPDWSSSEPLVRKLLVLYRVLWFSSIALWIVFVFG
jgi:hypothetical protein